jgi:hypothetical protein
MLNVLQNKETQKKSLLLARNVDFRTIEKIVQFSYFKLFGERLGDFKFQKKDGRRKVLEKVVTGLGYVRLGCAKEGSVMLFYDICSKQWLG